MASIAKAFKVLEVFAGNKSEISLTEVAQQSGVGRSAAQRILYTLTSIGYLLQDEQDRQYRLSPRILQLTKSYSIAEQLRAKAWDPLESANRDCEETINLTVLEETEVVYILRFPSKHVVSVNLTVGTRLPAFCTAPGRAMLAFLPEERAERILARSSRAPMTERTVVDLDSLRGILTAVRHDGYAISDQEAFIGDISVAAPVFDGSGAVVAAVNAAVAYPRWSLEQAKAQLPKLVMDTAKQVSRALAE